MITVASRSTGLEVGRRVALVSRRTYTSAGAPHRDRNMLPVQVLFEAPSVIGSRYVIPLLVFIGGLFERGP